MTARARRSRTALAGALVGALALSGCSVYDVPLPGGPDTGSDPIEVTARFRDVLDLVPNSTVKLNDLDVGRVAGVTLDGYVAEVRMQIRDDVELPANLFAQIRQTSLLGEKFVSLEMPTEPASSELEDGATIGLDRTGRNPEIEEVFNALALLLNGGGVGQLKSITQELNQAFDGRTEEIKSVLNELDTFVSAIDEDRETIVATLENLNRLAERARAQQGTIENALDDVPAALRSLDGQREDLVRLLESLTRLSDVGVRVIRESKDSTIASLEDLGPVLEGLADAGDALPKALQVYLTYPFIDEAVGRDPQVARNLRMGDYTNLSVDLDLDLLNLSLPGLPGLPEAVCDGVDDAAAAVQQLRDRIGQGLDDTVGPLVDELDDLVTGGEVRRLREELTERLLDDLLEGVRANCRAPSLADITERIEAELDGGELLVDLGIINVRQLRALVDGTLGQLLGGGSGNGGGGLLGGGSGGSGGSGGGLLGGLTPRAAPFAEDAAQIDPFGIAAHGLDPGVGTLLLQGVATQR